MSSETGNCGCDKLVEVRPKKSLPVIETTGFCGDGSCGCGCGGLLEDKEDRLGE